MKIFDVAANEIGTLLGGEIWLAVVAWLKNSSSMPNWLIVIGVVVALLLPLVLIVYWYFSHGKNSYVADEIDDYRWMWSYDRSGGVDKLALCCAQCGTQLLPQNYIHPRAPNGYSIDNRFICNCTNSKCNKSYEFKSDTGRWERDVTAIILAKRKNGAWKAAKKENARRERAFKNYF